MSFNNIDLNTLSMPTGFRILGEKAGDQSGQSISNAGDINGDGYSDIVVSSWYASPFGRNISGECYVIFGSQGGFSDIDLSTLSMPTGFKIFGGYSNGRIGSAVDNSGDINGDGYDDIIIGEYSSIGNNYIIFGKQSGFSNIDLSTFNTTIGFKIIAANNTDLLGYTVSNAGDINGDGYSDIITGSFNASPLGRTGAGISYIIFGKNSSFTDINLSTLSMPTGFRILGANSNDSSGVAVANGGDVNGDGYKDIIIGAYTASPLGRNQAGVSYVIFGKNSGFADIDLSTLSMPTGFKILGENGNSGWIVTNTGDINKDGYSDIIIGADNASPLGRTGAGESYVIFGNNSGFTDIDLSTLSMPTGFKILGANNNSISGRSISNAGDINKDGYDDIIIGAVNASLPNRTIAGESYVIFGKSNGFSDIDLNTLSMPTGFSISGANNNDASGVSVTNAGDINGDGIADIAIGAYGASPLGRISAGESYIIFGSNDTNSVSKHIRVLAINGGGVRGIIPATLLKSLSDSTGKQIPELFDFIIGTSIGGILAAAYATPKYLNSTDRSEVKFNASAVLNILTDNAGFIFPPDQANTGVSMLFNAKYSRTNLDSLLQQNFNVEGIDLRLIDTLVPITLTSQNAISNEPQLWFSCSNAFSTYLLKDVTGATSAAPVYLPPKFIPVQNQTQANAQDCGVFSLVSKDGVCQYKSLDGGLFANSPTLLSMYILNQVLLNKVTSECTVKYDVFGGAGSNIMNFSLEFASTNPPKAPQLALGQNIDVTVVSIGTGYFTETLPPIPPSFQGITLSIGIISTIACTLGIGATGYFIYNYKKMHDTFSTASEDHAPLPKIQFAIEVLVSGLFSLVTGAFTVLGFYGYNLVGNTESFGEGVVDLLVNGISGILSANEAADIATARDIFGTITINPIFNTGAISLDASDPTSINFMESTTLGFIQQSMQAFNNLSLCLQNTTQRIVECDYAAMYFYDNFRDSATHSINSKRGFLSQDLETLEGWDV